MRKMLTIAFVVLAEMAFRTILIADIGFAQEHLSEAAQISFAS